MGIKYEGGDGSSTQEAVVIVGAQNPFDGIRAEKEWISQQYPEWRLTLQRTAYEGDRCFDCLEFITPDDPEPKAAYFEITDFFGSNE